MGHNFISAIKTKTRSNANICHTLDSHRHLYLIHYRLLSILMSVHQQLDSVETELIDIPVITTTEQSQGIASLSIAVYRVS